MVQSKWYLLFFLLLVLEIEYDSTSVYLAVWCRAFLMLYDAMSVSFCLSNHPLPPLSVLHTDLSSQYMMQLQAVLPPLLVLPSVVVLCTHIASVRLCSVHETTVTVAFYVTKLHELYVCMYVGGGQS